MAQVNYDHIFLFSVNGHFPDAPGRLLSDEDANNERWNSQEAGRPISKRVAGPAPCSRWIRDKGDRPTDLLPRVFDQQHRLDNLFICLHNASRVDGKFRIGDGGGGAIFIAAGPWRGDDGID